MASSKQVSTGRHFMNLKKCHPLRRLKGRWFVPVMLTVAALLVAGTSGCGKSPEEKKAEKAAILAQTTGRLIAKSNRANTTVEATLIPAAGEAAPASVKGNAEQTMAALPPGKYTLTARADGWPDVREEVSVEAGRMTEVAINFKSGSLRLDSLPTGATVKQGNAVLGKTPLLLPQLPLGELQLTLEYPAWPVLPFKTTITENGETAETARLPHGKLVIESSPAGATVLFGKRAIGQTPLTIERYQAGNTKLTLQAKDLPPLEMTVAMEDRGELTLTPVLANGYPMLDPEALLRAVWVEEPREDPNRLAPAMKPFTSFPSQNGIVRNLNRRKLFETWLEKKYRFFGSVRFYDKERGLIEFAEQKGDLSRYRVVARLSSGARTDKETVARLTAKGATFAVYGRLSAVEEQAWPAKNITFELSAAEPLQGGIPAAP